MLMTSLLGPCSWATEVMVAATRRHAPGIRYLDFIIFLRCCHVIFVFFFRNQRANVIDDLPTLRLGECLLKGRHRASAFAELPKQRPIGLFPQLGAGKVAGTNGNAIAFERGGRRTVALAAGTVTRQAAEHKKFLALSDRRCISRNRVLLARGPGGSNPGFAFCFRRALGKACEQPQEKGDARTGQGQSMVNSWLAKRLRFNSRISRY